jgi:hypothetical protein
MTIPSYNEALAGVRDIVKAGAGKELLAHLDEMASQGLLDKDDAETFKTMFSMSEADHRAEARRLRADPRMLPELEEIADFHDLFADILSA